MLFCFRSLLRCSNIKNSVMGYREHWRYTKAPVKPASKIQYLLVLDFEATCEDTEKITQEIIEFPCLKINTTTYSVESTFHEYVRPIFIPQLSVFCIELTGIIQDMVDTADTFPVVFQRFEEWRCSNNLTEENSVLVTSGDWDLGKMFPSQCQLSEIEIPKYYQSWIDLKKLYYRQKGELPKSLIEMIRKCGLTFQGRQHSGIDDCINIANVLRYIGRNEEVDLRPTSILKKTPHGFKVVSLS